MCLFTHIAAGALAGALSPNIYLAPVLGLGSHIVLDVLPHYDFQSMKVEFLFAGLILVVFYGGGAVDAPILLGAVFAILPDLENLLWKLGKIRDDQKIFPGHVGVIPHGREAGLGNLGLQFIGSALVTVVLIRRII